MSILNIFGGLIDAISDHVDGVDMDVGTESPNGGPSNDPDRADDLIDTICAQAVGLFQKLKP